MTTSRRLAKLPLMLLGLAVIVALLPTSPLVQAQTTYAVSNLGQDDDGFTHFSNGFLTAQGFGTGTHPHGYGIDSVVVSFDQAFAGGVEVSLWDSYVNTDNGQRRPNSEVFKFASPASLVQGDNTFTAPTTEPARTKLEPNAVYFVVFRNLHNVNVRLDRTTSDNEDGGGLAGWSLWNLWASTSVTTGQWPANPTFSSDSAIQLGIVATERPANNEATGRPVILSPVDEAGVLYAHTLDIRDPDGIPFSGTEAAEVFFDKYHYQWIRVDGDDETHVGTDSSRYRLVGDDTGKLIKVEVWFDDHVGNAERVASSPFGPIVEPARLPAATLVGNTGKPALATATSITSDYSMGFRLGDHGQGYEISGVSIDLASAPTDLTVSLWMGKHIGSGQGGSTVKLFDFENPASFQAGLNKFTAPAGAFAYQAVEYFVVLSDFGASLSIKETASDNEDAGGEPGAELADSAGGDTNVLRLAVKGSRRDGGVLVSNFAQFGEGDQEVISIGDQCCFSMDVGGADRYLIRGFSWPADDTTTRNGGFGNPFELHEGSSYDLKDGAATRRLTMYNTRNNEGVGALTAPLGATVAGGSRTYTFLLDFDLGKAANGKEIERINADLSRVLLPDADGEDTPGAAGFDLDDYGDVATPDAPYVTVFGEPLYVMTSNLDQTDNGYANIGSGGANVLSQAFSTGPDEDGYDLLGIGVELTHADRVPHSSADVSVSVHAESGGKPGAKLFDLVSPTEYAVGHSFFEAPRGTRLDANTTYVMVWTRNGGDFHRLQRTTSDDEDPGSPSGFGVANTYYLGGDVNNLAADSGGNALQIEVYTDRRLPNATGRPVILSAVDEAGVLYAHTLDIRDVDGVPFSGLPEGHVHFDQYDYQWIRIDGGTETNIGTDSSRYRLVDADTGKQIRVEVSFTDAAGNAERVTSLPFGPVAERARLPETTLVSNTGKPALATATVVTSDYRMGFRLGDHGQGYEISGVSIDLATVPTDLTVSLWMGKHIGSGQGGSRVKLFDFENPASLRAGLNEFTAPAGAFAYQAVEYFVVLSDFGASLSIRETASNAEDAGGEPRAELADSAGGDTSVLRLAVKGSRRDGGVLVSNFAQFGEGDQEVISIGDQCCFSMDVGGADRYLIRGFSWPADDTTTRNGGFGNPFELHEGSSYDLKDGAATRRLTMYNTRNNEGVGALTAPLGATVAGGSRTYTFLLDFDLGKAANGKEIERINADLSRVLLPDADGEDTPGAAGFDLDDYGDVATPDAPYVTVFGEPLYVMTSNLGQSDNGYASLGGANAKVISQGFSTGSDEEGYDLVGIGVDIEGSDADGNPQVPDGPTFVSAAVHASADGKPGRKLFDLVSPTEYTPGLSFFEAPRGTRLEANTSYVLVWRYNGGTWHRLRRTTSNGEDAGSLTRFWVADSFYQGADLDNLNADANSNALKIAVYSNTPPPGNATGRPVILSPVDEAGVLYAHVLDIRDPDGIPFSGMSVSTTYLDQYHYQWIRVDGDDEISIGTDSSRYRLVDDDVGKLIKVEVWFDDYAGNPERVTSLPFGPIVEPARLPAATLVGNTGQPVKATVTNITSDYAMGFTLGDHGQGYEISGVSIDLGAAPTDLTVSLWMGKHTGSGVGGSRIKLFDFENPSSFQVGLNEFTPPAGAFAYQAVEYFVVLSGFGASLSIRETASDAEDAGGETGATLFNTAGGDSNVLRMAVKGSQRDGGILVSNFAQSGQGDQEVISVGDDCCFKMDVGGADRYLIRGFSWVSDDTTSRQGGWRNPFELHEGSADGIKDGAATRRLTMYNTRNNPGVTARAAPLGATVAGGDRTYTFLLDKDLGVDGEGVKIERLDAVLIRNLVPAADGEDIPGAAGFDLSPYGDAAYPDAPYVTVFGEPLNTMTSNFGQTDNGFHSLGSVSTKVVSQAFTTGSDEFGYRLKGIGVNIEGSNNSDGDPQVPDGPTFVSVSVHAESGGKPGAKLFDLASPAEYAVGHSFFEAPRGTHLAPSTNYVLVWRHNGGTWHRLQRTLSNGEDSGGVTNFGISDSLYRGANVDNLSEDPNSNALEIAVYGETNTQTQVFALPPGITVSSDTLNVSEGGSASYTVVLDARPTASVTIDVTAGGDVTVAPTSLTFTPDNWSTEQTVTVRAAGDDDAVDDEQTIIHAVDSGSAPEYAVLSVDSVAVTVTDDDEPGVTVSRDSLGVNEEGSGSYTVVLDAQPTASVTISITAGGDVTVMPISLPFSTTNWRTAQIVTVRAADDVDTTDDTLTVTHAVSSGSAAEYVGVNIDGVAVTVTDNDAPGVSLSRSTLRVNEGGSGTYTVQLASQPSAGVTIDITGGGDVTVSPTSLTFSTSNWGTARTVTVRAAEDADTAHDSQTISHTVRSNSAPEYTTLSVRSVAVTVNDNDDPEVTVSFQQGNYTVPEGGSVTVQVRLSEVPRRTVDIPLTTTNLGGASPSDYSGIPSNVRFHGGAVLRSFTFRAAEDTVNDVGESVRFGFGRLPALVTAGAATEATVSIGNLDPDTPNRAPTLSAMGRHGTIYAGESLTLDGTASDPDGDPLTYLWTSDSGGVFSPGPDRLESAWIAPATETAFTANLTLTATDPHGLSASVTVSVVVEPLPQPIAATGLLSTVSDDNTVVLTWTIPDQPRDVTIDEVQVQRWNSRGTFEIPTWDTVLTLPGTATFTGLPELAADTEYRFRVRLTSNHGLTADSRALRVRTLAEAPAPRHFRTQWPTQTSITLVWFTVETAAEYKLEYRKDGGTDWTRVSGDFDHLPSTTDRRDAFGVAAGLDCETGYHFRVSARGSGEERNDGSRYPSGSFGSYATTSARTGGCAQEERVTNLLVSVEPLCATLTWTPPSGNRDTGYRVERYGSSGYETLVEQSSRVADRYQDCSAEYRTAGARHSYIVTALDSDPGPDEEGAFGAAYTSRLVYGPGWEPDGPRNVRLTQDTQFIRGLAWDAPWDPWLSTVHTARAGSGSQQVVADPWVTGYRVERREYRRTVEGDWYFPEVDEETLLATTLTVGHYDPPGPDTGFSSTENPFSSGELTTDTFSDGSTSYRMRHILWISGTQLIVTVDPSPPASVYDNWRLLFGVRKYLFSDVTPTDATDISGSTFYWVEFNQPWNINDAVSIALIKRETLDWETVRDETDGDTGTSFTDPTDKGDRQYVYRVWPYNGRGLSHYSYRGDWAFNGGDPGGNPVDPPPPQLQQGPQQVGETPGPADDPTPTNSPATGAPAISGTPRVGETLTASTSGISDADGLNSVSYRYQWLAGGSDIEGATGSAYELTSSEQGKTIQVRVTFTDDADHVETLTSVATVAVAAAANRGATGAPTIIGTPQVGETLTADTSAIDDADGMTGANFVYSWNAGERHIQGATGVSYTLTGDQQGLAMQVLVAFVDDKGNSEVLASEASDPVAAKGNTAPTGLPAISGTPQVGETLTADTSEISDADGLTNVSYRYQWTAGGTDIAGATGASYQLTSSEQGKTIQVRVTFTDDRGSSESLTSEATVAVAAKPVPLTASFSNVPASHSGSGTTFTFDLAFSENFPLSYITLRDHAFSEDDDGPVTRAQRKVQGSNQTWTITVEPQGNGPITVTLPATTDCNDSGAICTGDGRKLSNLLSFTVSGPGG